MADGLNMLPRIGEPETSGVTGRSFPGPELTAGGPSQFLAPNIPDTSGPGPTPLQQPGAWAYDFDPASGIARATFNGEVVPSGGGGSGDVTSWNTRTGDVTLLLSDITAAGGAPIASPVFTGNPAAPTRLAGDSSGGLATTAFVQQAIAGNPAVSSFNTRTGAVTLLTADVLAAGGAPLASPALTGTPTATTAPQGDVSNRIATDAFVSNALASGAVTSFNGRQGTVALTLSDVQSVGGAPIASPTFTGVPAVPTAAPGSATTQAASTAFVTNAITAGTAGVSSVNTRTGAVVLNASDLAAMGGAPLLSPHLTGTPTAPTPSAGDNSTSLATTAFVETAVAALPVGVASWNGRIGTVTLALSDVTSVGGAPLASPIFTGTPEAPTPPALDNSLRLATTAFVDAALPIASTATPLVNGTASVGVDPGFSHGDHIHPTDTSRAAASALAGYLPLSGGALTGGLTSSAGATFGSTVSGSLVLATGSAMRINQTGSNAIQLQMFAPNGTTQVGNLNWNANVLSLANFGSAGTGLGGITVNANGYLIADHQIGSAVGYMSRAGLAGPYGGNNWNYNWNGTNQVCWIDGSNLGNVTLSSDYRIKREVEPLPSTWDRVKALNPISFKFQDWTPPGMIGADQGDVAPAPLFVEDDVERWGFIAHELQETLIPDAATGVKDDPVHVQSPNPWTVIASLTRALQEAMARIEALEAAT